ncbi:NHSL1 protein, partial [Oreotrochilus melanogaster]|nr:NHSL1 protein [Oreotrochilus melanogaster]
ATSNLDLESKKASHPKLSWQQPVNVFLAAGRPPGMEELHQEAQLNLQSLLQGNRAAGSRVGDDPLGGHLPFPLQPPSQRATEEETTGTTALSARPPDTSLSLLTSPDKQPAWPRALPLHTVEEKQWHRSCSVQTNIVPINVS